VRAPGLHPPQNRPLVGRVPSPGVPISFIMRIAAEAQRFAEIRREFFFSAFLRVPLHCYL